MALVKLGLYATAGYTEVGGLQRFLEAWLPGVTVDRRFPAGKRVKGRTTELAVGAGALPGLTGPALIAEIVRRIGAHGLGGCDAVVVADDADCRFECARRTGLSTFAEDVVRRVRTAAGRPELPVFVLLAAPEVEGWLLADLERTFGDREYLSGHYSSGLDTAALRQALKVHGPALPAGGWEAYGCPLAPGGTGCTHKLSDDLAAVLAALPGATVGYSKRRDGPLLLQRARPDIVASRCPLYAGPALQGLRAWWTSAAP